MCPAIDNLTSCEICTFIRFLHAKKMSAAEIHLELCTVCGQNVISEGTVRQWCRMFRDGQTDVHNEEQSGRPSVVSDDLVRNERKKQF
jgi:transposase